MSYRINIEAKMNQLFLLSAAYYIAQLRCIVTRATARSSTLMMSTMKVNGTAGTGVAGAGCTTPTVSSTKESGTTTSAAGRGCYD